MLGLLATQHTGAILGPVAKLLGWIMNAIFNLMDSLFNVQNVGLSIILFTIVVYVCMLPLTYKQQKFSKMNAKMNPELQAIRKKYAGKTDQASAMAMNDETKAVYAKYGVSPSGSCVQLLIQMPILFALYRVIYNVPAYITGVKEVFMPLVTKLITMDGAVEYMTEVGKALGVSKKLDFAAANTFVDVLNKFQSAEWADLAVKYPELSDLIVNTQAEIDQMNTFLGINIAYSPSNLLKSGSIVLMIGAIAIPVLAALTQWLNTKLMPQPAASENSDDAMSQSMKQMNLMMPLMSAVFCFTLPSGMGLYWIASALVRSVQQFILNKHFDKIDLDELIAKNLEKVNEKRAKQGLPPQKLNEKAIRAAQMQTKPVDEEKAAAKKALNQENIKKATAFYNENAKPGSLASKANMVRKFEEKNTKK